MTTNVKYNAHTIKIQPIDRDKINAAINKEYPDPNPLVTWEIAHGLGIIKFPKKAVISSDLVGHDINDNVILSLYRKEKTDRGFSHGCLPEHEITLTLEELEQYLLPEITLHEFADQGYETHHRRSANYAIWLNHFNS